MDWQFERIAAEAEIRRLSGVAGVNNLITIKPRVNATDVKRNIENALKRSAEIEAQGIRMVVENANGAVIDDNEIEGLTAARSR